MLKKLRLKIGLTKLRKLQKGVDRFKKVYNLVSARKVGIISYACNDSDFEQALKLVKLLNDKNLEVCLLAFYPEKEIPEKYLLRKNANVLSSKDLNWYYKPLSPLADDFIKMDFDILINLSMVEVFPIRWVTSLSKAKFKVGCLSYFGNPNDLIIKIKPEDNLEYFISQVVHYLMLINNRFAQEKEFSNNS